MNVWFIAAAALVALAAPLFILALRGSIIDGIVAVQLTGVLITLSLLLLSEAFADTALADPAVVLAMLTLGGGLVYLHFSSRWI